MFLHSVSSLKMDGRMLTLLAKEENRRCADCGTLKPRWASHSLGVFICLRCAGVHRSLGTHISKIKSCDLDSWTSDQLSAMESMGNGAAESLYGPSYRVTHCTTELPNSHALTAFIKDKYERRIYSFGNTDRFEDNKPYTARSFIKEREIPVQQEENRKSVPLIDLFGDDDVGVAKTTTVAERKSTVPERKESLLDTEWGDFQFAPPLGGGVKEKKETDNLFSFNDDENGDPFAQLTRRSSSVSSYSAISPSFPVLVAPPPTPTTPAIRLPLRPNQDAPFLTASSAPKTHFDLNSDLLSLTASMGSANVTDSTKAEVATGWADFGSPNVNTLTPTSTSVVSPPAMRTNEEILALFGASAPNKSGQRLRLSPRNVLQCSAAAAALGTFDVNGKTKDVDTVSF